jgi:hypothetical protein
VEKVIENDIRNLYATGVISNARIFGEKLDDRMDISGKELPGGVKIIVVIQEEVTR